MDRKFYILFASISVISGQIFSSLRLCASAGYCFIFFRRDAETPGSKHERLERHEPLESFGKEKYF